MKRKTLSIIVPNYNYSAFLKQAIDSILVQTRSPDQIIIIDDGSTDDSVEIIEKLTKDIPFATLIKNKINMGIEFSLNLGLQKASKDYVSFLAVDDIYALDFVYEMMKFVEEYPNASLCCSIPAFFKNENDFWADDMSLYERKLIGSDELINIMKTTKFWIATHTSIIKTETLRLFFFDKNLKYYSDWYAVLNIAFKNKIGFIPKTLAFMRVHFFAYSRQAKKYNELKMVYKALFNKIEKEDDIFKNRFINSRALVALDSHLFIFLLFRLKYWKYLPSFIVGKIIKFKNRVKNNISKVLMRKKNTVSKPVVQQIKK